MTIHSITLDIPQPVYDQIQRAAEKTNRQVGDLLLEALSAVAPVLASTSDGLQAALAGMTLLNDAALWQAAQASMPADQRERLSALHHKGQQNGLSVEEAAEEAALLKLYRETLLVRAQAAVLLNQRNYDVSDPSQFLHFD